MRIAFLGTGPAQAIPRPGHLDALCRDALAGGKSRRQRSAILVKTNGTIILIDAGPDIWKQLETTSPKRISAVLLTHSHSDAVDGLKDLDRWLKRKIKPETPVPVYIDRGSISRLTSKFGKFEFLKFHELKEFSKLYFGKTIVTAFPVLHTRNSKIKTFGYYFGSWAYASDFYDLPRPTRHLLQGIDTAILDGAMYIGIKKPTHMSADATVRLATELKIKRLILTQSGHTYPPHDVAQATIRTYAKSLDTRFPERVYLAFDGLKVLTP